MQAQMKRAGFSLIEIVVAISIISILAAVMVPVVSGIMDDARVATVKSDLAVIKKAYLEYFTDTGRWPGNDGNYWDRNTFNDPLDSDNYLLYSDTRNTNGWDGPYLEKGALGADGTNMAFCDSGNGVGLLDPWGYRYRVRGLAAGAQAGVPSGALVIYSRGPDNQLDTSDANMAVGRGGDDDVVMIVTVKP